MGNYWSSAPPAYNLKDKVVIVTGASAGIGKQLAIDLATQKGAKVVLAARSHSQLERVAQACAPAETLIVPTDVSKQEDVQALMKKTLEAFGKIDVVINNAGISQTQLFGELELARYHEIMNVNYFGTLYCTYYSLDALKESNGMIVAVSSMSGKVGVPGRTGYCASKYAIHGFLESLRTELVVDKSQVHIMIACPGYVKTDIRAAASADGSDRINDTDIMSVEECSAQILTGMETKQREVLVVSSLLAMAVPYVKPFAPDFVDKAVIKKAKGGRT